MGQTLFRTIASPLTAHPSLSLPGVRFLSNGTFTTMVTPSGRGFTKYRHFHLNQWTGDPIGDCSGWQMYLRDAESGVFWRFDEGEAEPEKESREPGICRMCRRKDGVEVDVQVCVDPSSNLELRRVTLRNAGTRARRMDMTFFLDVVLNHPAAHASHPAFSKLFVQTEFVADAEGILVRRRPRSAGEECPWMIHALSGPGPLEHETDRLRFMGRGRREGQPLALSGAGPLSGTTGNILDPCLATRRSVTLAAGAIAELTLLLGAATRRDEVLAMLAALRDAGGFAKVAGAARGKAQEGLIALGLSAAEALDLEALAGAMYYSEPALGASPEVMARANDRPWALGAYKIASDRPYAVVCARGDGSRDPAVASLCKAQRLWRSLGLDTLVAVLTEENSAAPADNAGGTIIYHRLAEVPKNHLPLLLGTARLVTGELAPRLAGAPPLRVTAREETRTAKPASPPAQPAAAAAPLLFDNGYGGFSQDGREYVIRVDAGPDGVRVPPLPWINVIANPGFGFLISETGAGYTWARNSREHRLTPWSNDPVLDPHGDALYLRDEVTGAFWSPMPGPCPADGRYTVRHGFGYSGFAHTRGEIEQETTVFVAREDPVKFARLRLRNTGRQTRKISVFSYQKLILGSPPAESARFIETSHDAAGRALFAGNRAGGDFADGIAFATAAGPAVSWTCTGDRRAFLGDDGSPAAPGALARGGPLDSRTGPGLDPCFAQQCLLEIPPGEERNITFLLGEATAEGQARALLKKYSDPAAIDAALTEATSFWTGLLSGIEIETPSKAVDLMANGWLAYQNLACRIWARSAFYQSGGAFGYRDQLQDAAGLVYLDPGIARRQILLHAAHQFAEGDVLHWWHTPPIGRGLRTRFSDDLNWLPYVTAYYVRATGDASVLDERAPFLKTRLLEPGEDEVYTGYEPSGGTGDVYEHGCRALDLSLTQGAHGLPLMGTGDWNDGMNRVGREGRGESVWMGFFLYHVIGEFLPLCEKRGDTGRIAKYRAYRSALESALNDAGWDGEWYRRAYYDDGTPLGSRESDECRIDALAQAWAVISGVAPAGRAAQALDAVEAHLVSAEGRLIRLLTPPFADTPHDPGYIKGYVRGVRENGGQYTHAACWVVRAFAEAGRHDRAVELLEMLCPATHAADARGADTYKVEPYVVVADIYGEAPHVGRGGWSWYTGSAGWLHRVILESILGFTLEGGNTLVLRPRIPAQWPGFKIRYRSPGGTVHQIEVRNTGRGARVASARCDGQPAPIENGAARIPVAGDGGTHEVSIELGA